MYYLNARYYNSNIGRFLTEDTYRGRQQDPLSLHRYTYCHNNPLKYYDPSGHNAASIEAEFSWLRDVDGPYPYGDMVYFILFGVAFIATSGTIDIPIKFGGEPYSGPLPETEPYPAPQKPIEFAGETYSESSSETGLYPAPYPAPRNNISINTDGNIGPMVDPVYDGMRSRILWFPIENARRHILETPQYNDEPIWVLKDPVIENSGPQIMVDPIPYDTSIHIYQSNKGTDKSNGDGTGSGAYQSGKASELPAIEKGTKEWDEAVKSIANGGNTSYRTRTATEAKELLNEARGNMNKYKQYTSKQYKKGYEMHPNEINTRNAPHNDLPHVKWKDWLDELHSGKGHIFFDTPN